MKHVASPAALVTGGAFCILGAGALLALQVVLGLEYTAGGSAGTQLSMIAAMVALFLLPMFVALARRHGAGKYAAALSIAFVAFLAYSLPATTGRSGEIKEAKASTAEDVARHKAELASIALTLSVAKPDMLAECDGAPDPLPPEGWPKCRRKKGTVTSLEERQAKLETEVKAAGTSGATGDLGSTLWAWALSWFGMTAATIRKVSVLSFAVGIDFAIFALGGLAEHLIAMAFAVIGERKAAHAETQAPTRQPLSPSEQSDFGGSDTDEARKLGIGGEPGAGNWGNSGNSGKNCGNDDTGNRGNPPNGGGNRGNGGGNNGGKRVYSRAEALLDVTRRLASGETVDAQDQLAEAWGRNKSTVSKWLKRWRADDLIPTSQRVGRCHRLAPAD